MPPSADDDELTVVENPAANYQSAATDPELTIIEEDLTVIDGPPPVPAPSPQRAAQAHHSDDDFWTPEVPSGDRWHDAERDLVEIPHATQSGDDLYRTVAAVPLASESPKGSNALGQIRSALPLVLAVLALLVVAFVAGVWWAGRADATSLLVSALLG